MDNWRKLIFIAVCAAVIGSMASPVQAQRGGGSRGGGQVWPPGQGVDFSAGYGWMWGGNVQSTYGKFRIGSGESLFFALDIPIRPGSWIELSYTRQNSTLDWQPNLLPKETLSDMSVNYWQIGGIHGIPRGNLFPYISFSLGATYYSPTESSATLSGVPAPNTIPLDSTTKFSIVFGAGFKALLGQAKRIGLRGSFRVFSTLYNTGGGLFFGTGGVSAGITGNAIWSYEVSGGIVINFPR